MKKKSTWLFTSVMVAGFYSATAQYNAVVHGNVHIHTDGNLAFYGDVDVPTGGLLRNEAGTLYTRADVTGEERIQLDEDANLDVDGGTFTFANEVDEKINNLSIGTNGITEVTPGNSLEVAGILNNGNNASGDSIAGINLYANATGYAQLLTSGSVASKGATYAQQYLTATTNEGWRQLASPVATTLAEIDDDLKTFYPAGPGPVGISNQWNVWWYDASPRTDLTGPVSPASDISSANAKHWTAAGSNSLAFGPANNARAYNVYSGGVFGPTRGGLITVRGAIGNDAYTFDCYATHDFIPGTGGETNQLLITGWNLIPNPYPSNIDVSALLADNTNFDLAYKAVHVWNAKVQQYSAITNDIANAIDWNTGDETSNTIVPATNNIAPFQAFWVKADYTSPSASTTASENILINNTHRTVYANMNFFKQTPPVMAIRVWNEDGSAKDQALMAFDLAYNNQIDATDAFKLKSSNKEMPSLSTMINGAKLSINRMALPEPSHSIAMPFEAYEDGLPYKITIAKQDIDPSWSVYLEDKKLNKMVNMTGAEVYAFNHDTKMKDNRFVVHINKTGGQLPESNQAIQIYGSQEGIHVAFLKPASATADIVISNAAGQTLYRGTVSTGGVFVYPTFSNVSLYVVHVQTGLETTHKKIVK